MYFLSSNNLHRKLDNFYFFLLFHYNLFEMVGLVSIQMYSKTFLFEVFLF